MRDVDWRGYRYATWFLVGTLAVLTVVTGVSRTLSAALVLGIFLIATLVYLLIAQRSVPAVFNTIAVTAIIGNAVGWSWGVFETLWGYDEIAHFLGTMAAALIVGWYAFRQVRGPLNRHGWTMAIAVTALGVALGALWEVVEWAGFHLLLTRAPFEALDDKISDLAADSLGALGAAALFRWALKRRCGTEGEGLPRGHVVGVGSRSHA